MVTSPQAGKFVCWHDTRYKISLVRSTLENLCSLYVNNIRWVYLFNCLVILVSIRKTDCVVTAVARESGRGATLPCGCPSALHCGSLGDRALFCAQGATCVHNGGRILAQMFGI